MKIKKATKKDIDFILKVRNQKISRKFSINKKKISHLEHNHWFKLNYLEKTFSSTREIRKVIEEIGQAGTFDPTESKKTK